MPSTPIQQLPYPGTGDTVDVPRDVQALAEKLDPLGYAPVGAVMMWPTAIAPLAWLLCNGAQVNAATYPALAAVLGSAGGLITLPNFTDSFPMGPGVAALLSAGGANTVALVPTNMPKHNHGGATAGTSTDLQHTHPIPMDPGHQHPAYGSGAGGTFLGAVGAAFSTFVQFVSGAPMINLQANPLTDPAGAHNHGGATLGTGTNLQHTHPVANDGGRAGDGLGGSEPHENRPKFVTLNFIIRAT